ncbi:hypothetical protein [Hymenobacter sp. BT491]|uniref:hypothetical protein n=1 Tax=Hymenobacter sp. BT491 TaxID=2766779 RepID=UPI001653C159|nr:hypothetical protein [Hymenobacter sp. BT491]MBC6990477.1 hypothetical protein [Hymenobacter sp. BT491]
MSNLHYKELLQIAFSTEAEAAYYLTDAEKAAYITFTKASGTERPFRFERVRLGVAMALMKMLADLGDHEESRHVLDLLHRALGARSAAEIDNIITRDAKLFERLFTNLYVNEDGEQVLHLFERTLDADTQPAMDEVIEDALAVAQELDFTREEEDED